MASPLDDLDVLGAELTRRARAAGVRLVWRAQERRVRRVTVQRGRPESTIAVTLAGHGVQVVDADGRTALSSRDDLRPEPALDLLERTLAVTRAGVELGLARAALVDLAPTRGRSIGGDVRRLESVDLGAVTRRLTEIESAILGQVPGVTLQSGYRAEMDAWRIMREDGTDVAFTMPRATLTVRATTGDTADSRHGISASVFDPDPLLQDDPRVLDLLRRRAVAAARLARDLPAAPAHPAGSFPLVIDYALAKGLAHEAFGHAAEADGFRSSVLARDGRFRTGERVGPDHVSIIDEPLEKDHAWQPFSANGIPRQRAVIVERGVLRDALSDPWSAGPAGVRLTGAERAESFRHAPQPRMTNIRIEVEAPHPAPGAFEDYGPGELHDLLQAAGVFRRHPQVTYLSGYTGGQVNPATGDFVFQCKAIYDLGRHGIALFRPGIFSGSMFGALESVREAFGPLLLDALGYCGKWGQSVPSSGGSHFFLVLDPHPSVRLGGR